MRLYLSYVVFLLFGEFWGASAMLAGQEQSIEETASSENLKRSFIGIELGQTREQFRDQIHLPKNFQRDDTLPDGYYYFLYNELDSEIQGNEGKIVKDGPHSRALIEVRGSGFITKGVFQFAVMEEAEPKLVAITIFLDPQWSSYDQLFLKLTKNYGNPKQLNPQRSIWEDEQTIITLEKQIRYKILDKNYLNKLNAEEQKEFDLFQYKYKEFLDKF